MHRITRYPRGTWMKLVSAQHLRSFVGPEHDKRMSSRKLARYCRLHPSFIGRRDQRDARRPMRPLGPCRRAAVCGLHLASPVEAKWSGSTPSALNPGPFIVPHTTGVLP